MTYYNINQYQFLQNTSVLVAVCSMIGLLWIFQITLMNLNHFCTCMLSVTWQTEVTTNIHNTQSLFVAQYKSLSFVNLFLLMNYEPCFVQDCEWLEPLHYYELDCTYDLHCLLYVDAVTSNIHNTWSGDNFIYLLCICKCWYSHM